MKNSILLCLVLFSNPSFCLDHLKEVDFKELKKVIDLTKQFPIKAVVMFYSPVCPHCQIFMPFLKKTAEEFYEKKILVTFYKINAFNH